MTTTNSDYSPETQRIDHSDYKEFASELLANIAFQIFLIREFEETLLRLSVDNCVHGPVHTSIGQEACAAGAMAALRPSDKLASTHRAHHHYLSKVINYYSAESFNILDGDIPDVIQQEITTLMGEIMGLSIGCCGGRGGSMHLRNEKIGVIGTNAIVSGGVPLATGAAFAEKYQSTGDVIICFLGDGAVNQGSFHEALNLAAIWRLPIIYFIENNQYAVATSAERSTLPADLAIKADAYGIKSMITDGMDPVAVMKSVNAAAQHVRKESAPILIEAKCYRFLHHAGPTAGSGFGYREKDEEDKWKEKDPHSAYPEALITNRIFSPDQIENIQKFAVDAVKTAVDFCTNYRDGQHEVKNELWPQPETIELGIRSDGCEFQRIRFQEIESFNEFESIAYSDAIAAVTGRHLGKDDRVFVLGEEVANFGGGPYGATKNLPQKYPKRVLNTPISECGFTGLAGGAAMSGLRPVVEIMFPDFALVAADQLFNQIGKLRHMYGNSADMPIVVRTRIAIGCGYGGQHSGDPAGLFSLFSGWHIVVPSNAFDYIGLFNSAMMCKDPVLIIEHHSLYSKTFQVPKDNLDYFIPLGKAKVVREGPDISVVCYSSTVGLVETVLDDLSAEGIEVEIIDPRTLDPADIDYETIGRSLKKTGVLAVVEQCPESAGIGSRIACECQKRFFDYLDGPIETISGLDIPLPVSKVLETAAVPAHESVRDTLYKAATRTI